MDRGSEIGRLVIPRSYIPCRYTASQPIVMPEQETSRCNEGWVYGTSVATSESDERVSLVA